MSSRDAGSADTITRDPTTSTPRRHELPGSLLERVIIHGDLAVLNAEERSAYYLRVCETIGLNPLTRPFRFITLNGELRLYALKDCTDQLRAIHGVSVEKLSESERGGVLVITAKVRNRTGRTDIAKGAVAIADLKGEDRANALMKTETKAKRRATLSICGLGILDESEIDDIPDTQRGGDAPKPTLPMPPTLALVGGRAPVTDWVTNGTGFDPERFLAQLKDRFDEAVRSSDLNAVEEVRLCNLDTIEERLTRSNREIAVGYYEDAQRRLMEPRRSSRHASPPQAE